jgi:hypothetical protein
MLLTLQRECVALGPGSGPSASQSPREGARLDSQDAFFPEEISTGPKWRTRSEVMEQDHLKDTSNHASFAYER